MIVANPYFSDTKQTRVVKKTVPTESFFNFFDPPKAPESEEDDASSDIEERLELDYQLGEDIKEKLIPRAIDWFTGEALQFEELEEADEGEFVEQDDDEDDEQDDDRSDEDESDEEVCPETAYYLSIPRKGNNQLTDMPSPQGDGSKPKQKEAAECKQS